MKKNSFLWRRWQSSIYLSSCLLFALAILVSCAQGIDDDEAFSGGVTNTQLSSPDASKITIKTVMNSSTGSENLKIEWPVVYGAGGYLVSVYNVDDPENQIVIDEDVQVDGCAYQWPKAEETKYLILIKALGSEKYNNQTAADATEYLYSTYISSYQTIPSGVDLADYFKTNPVPDPDPELAEFIYELEADGVYTMNDNVDLRYSNVTLRGDKVSRAQITVTGEASFVSEGAGFKIRWADIDLTGYTGTGFLQYKKEINTSNPSTIYDSSSAPWIVVEAASGFESCNIKGLDNSLIKDNGSKYALRSFTFNDCVVQQTATAVNPFINFTGALIKELTMLNSTFYSLNKSYSSNWIVYANVRVVQVADRAVWATEKGSINIKNSTFWQVAYKKSIFNSNGWAQKSNSVTVTNSIFEDTGNKRVLRDLRMSNANNVPGTFLNNTYWYDGALCESELTDSRGDQTGTHLTTSPDLRDPANGDFTVGGSEQKAKATGDPRWLE